MVEFEEQMAKQRSRNRAGKAGPHVERRAGEAWAVSAVRRHRRSALKSVGDTDHPPLEVVAIELRQASEFVAEHHRHHKPDVGHRFSIGARRCDTGRLVGVVIVGRPKARLIDQHRVVEVTRLATDGTKNACSLLYAAAARAAKAIGYDEIITYTLDAEPGTSLCAAGWEEVGEVRAQEWTRPSRRRAPSLAAPRRKWRRILRTGTPTSSLPPGSLPAGLVAIRDSACRPHRARDNVHPAETNATS